MRYKKKLLGWICVTVILNIAACAHTSKVQPSKGHVDGQAGISASKPIVADIPKPITNTPYLPPPKPRAKEQTYSIVVYDTPVKEVLFAIARDSKLNVDIHPGIQGRVTLNAVDQTLPAILERLSKQVDLTYKIENNVLTITPDQPVLRTYKVDYLNMSRDTKGFIGSAAEISSTGQAATTGSGGTSTTTSSSGNGSSNSSRTAVTTEAKNHLWESLIQNIKDILAETDKEVIVTRFGSLDDKSTTTKEGSSAADKNQADANKTATELRNEQRSEYKTLFAANVIANPETGVISVRATSKQHAKVQEFIDRVMFSARKQVLIEATIVEVVLNDSFQAGIDWSRLNNGANNSGFVFGQTLGSKGVNFSPNVNFNPNTGTGVSTQFGAGGANAFGTTSTAGFVAGYINPTSVLGNIAASITLLKQFGDTKVLSSPKLMVLNNQTAVLKVVDNLVYFTVQAQQSQAAVGGSTLSTITTTPNTVPVGVVMSVTPQINDSGNVGINVRPTITRVVGRVQDPNPALNNIPSFIPQIQVREMESLLQINSGNTAVLGGLMQDEIQRNTDKVPGLSSIPGVGKVFTGRNDGNRKTELVIFLRPTVIANASLESDELATYKQYLPSEQLKQKLEQDDER